MRQEYLTLKESVDLVMRGIDPNDASHCMIHFDEDGEQISGFEYANTGCSEPPKIVDKDDNFDHSYENDCPIFTIMDVIRLCPSVLKLDIPQDMGGGILKYKFTISGQENGSFKVGYSVGDNYWFIEFYEDELAHALYKLVCDLIERGLI